MSSSRMPNLKHWWFSFSEWFDTRAKTATTRSCSSTKHKANVPRCTTSQDMHVAMLLLPRICTMRLQGKNDCVEKFSLSAPKTSFISRDEQNKCANFALSSRAAKEALDRLNQGSVSEMVEVDISELKLEMVKYRKGAISGGRTPAKHVVMILRHQRRQKNNKLREEVHIHTIYPKWDDARFNMKFHDYSTCCTDLDHRVR